MSNKVDFRFVLFLECSQEICVERCIKRGVAGSGRYDDNAEVLRQRFNNYMSGSMCIIDHFRELGKVKQVDSEKSPEAVFEDIKLIFENLDERHAS